MFLALPKQRNAQRIAETEDHSRRHIARIIFDFGFSCNFTVRHRCYRVFVSLLSERRQSLGLLAVCFQVLHQTTEIHQVSTLIISAAPVLTNRILKQLVAALTN